MLYSGGGMGTIRVGERGGCARTAEEVEEGASEPVPQEAEAREDPLGLAKLQKYNQDAEDHVPHLRGGGRGGG